MCASCPEAVRTYQHMCMYARTLFGDCNIENLLTGTTFDWPGCFLIRVKGACTKGNWQKWPDLIDDAMQETVRLYERRDIIEVKSKWGSAHKRRMYDTLQVTPNACSCRVYFGGDNHHKLQVGSSATTATEAMAKMLMEKFKPTTEKWDGNQPGYHAKAFHLLLNRYGRNDGIDAHHDESKTYHCNNPITSLSYGRGSILVITDSNKPLKQKTGLYY